MCGIVGYIGPQPVVPVIIEGLRRLEYRGYDSAGIAVAGAGNPLQLRRAPGKLRNLETVIADSPLHGTYGIGHTRWATHGRPTEENAHPHRDGTGTLVVVHNGIVENYLSLKSALIAKGHTFQSETDTEIIAHVIEDEISLHPGINLEEAVRKAVHRLTGAFAIGVLSAHEPDKLVAARMGPPAVRGLGDAECSKAAGVTGILCRIRSIRLPAGRRTSRPHPHRRNSVRLRRQTPPPEIHAHSLGPHPGREGRLQALHAQGDPRAAPRHPRHHSRPHLPSTPAASISATCLSPTPTSAPPPRSPSTPAEPPGTRTRPENSRSSA